MTREGEMVITWQEVRDFLADVIGWFTYNPARSWLGHAAQGLIFGAVGVFVGWLIYQMGPWTVMTLLSFAGILYTHGAFSHREADNFLQVLLRHGWKEAWRQLATDGWPDYMAPMIASLIGWALASGWLL